MVMVEDNLRAISWEFQSLLIHLLVESFKREGGGGGYSLHKDEVGLTATVKCNGSKENYYIGSAIFILTPD